MNPVSQYAPFIMDQALTLVNDTEVSSPTYPINERHGFMCYSTSLG